ncbi:G-type lectin S-receptor-like serine/threonine-protein kinase At1g11300 [Camellia sinensis]|uniref:G-type lectin S-receptor-like serine/threonine-protein kinase At1g11300 n=1 Tax=Camellia sinensis TaxID=4442 RepID=UPI001035C547|nr:G-type lectin S-receptor-like serine/threonine-protein kinase At1g11300 [Camellia sinensis]
MKVSKPLQFFIRNCFTNSNQNSLIARIVSTFNILFNGLPAFRVENSQKRSYSDFPVQVITPIKGDVSGGCVRKAPLQCGNDSQANGQSDHDGCSIWSEDLFNVEQLKDDDPDRSDFYLKLSASAFLSEGKNNGIVAIVLIQEGRGGMVYSSTCSFHDTVDFNLVLLFVEEDNATKQSIGVANCTLNEASKDLIGGKKEVALPLFSFTSVSSATDNFFDANKLGEAGFGPVYKGKLLKGYEVAVKRLSRKSRQGLEELQNKAMLIVKLQHKNLVRLLGCCIERDEKILIYEHMPNKSLDFFLFDPIKHGILNCELRVNIIEVIAQGFFCLHQYSRLQIIHRDLKTSNILLDKDMNPKISDFGMARIFSGNGSQATNRIVGTYGYMSPEYAFDGLFSIKSDVFSFGVLLLEILSGKKNTHFYLTNSVNLLVYAWDLWKSGMGQDLKDPILGDILSTRMLLRYINIGLLCVQESVVDRRTMSSVVSMLSNELVLLPSSKQPAFSTITSVPDWTSCKIPEICSLNDVTVSVLEAW